MAGLANITVVCAAGEVNGGFFGILGQMVQMYEAQGADFSFCETDEEKLAVRKGVITQAQYTEITGKEIHLIKKGRKRL